MGFTLGLRNFRPNKFDDRVCGSKDHSQGSSFAIFGKAALTASNPRIIVSPKKGFSIYKPGRYHPYRRTASKILAIAIDIHMPTGATKNVAVFELGYKRHTRNSTIIRIPIFPTSPGTRLVLLKA